MVGVGLGEEGVGGGLTFAVGAPRHAASPVIADERQVMVALAPRDLVDRDLKEVVEPVGGEQLSADAIDDPPGRLPVDPCQPTRRGPVGLGQKPRDEDPRIAREPRTVARERDTLHVHTVHRAAHPPQPRANLKAPPGAKIQMAPDRIMMLLVLAMARLEVALWALQAPAAQRDRDHRLGRARNRPRAPRPWAAQASEKMRS